MDDVLVVGEALVDIVERPGAPTVEHPGGSPANVALGLARLGRRANLLTRIGDDPRGRVVRAHLEASGVRLVPGSVTGERTSTATAHLDPSGAATYDFDLDWRLPEGPSPEPGACIHTGSIAAFLPPGGDAVLALVEKAAGRATISYDPNARPRLMGDPATARQRVETLVRHADVVKVSDEDLAWLAPGEDLVAVAASWLAGGPAVVIVTLGAEGAIGLCTAGRVDVPAPAIGVVDTVGAGDSFMAGLLDQLATLDLLGPQRLVDLRAIGLPDLQGMLTHATRIAAITCTRAGANPPTRAELDAWTG
jgi:fructokinase